MVCPQFGGVVLLDCMPMTWEKVGMPKGYPAEFRRRALDLVRSGRPVAQVAADLGISAQAIYNWRKQDQIDRGERSGLTSSDREELVAARRRIAQLEAELAATRRANELLREVVLPKGGSRRSR
jgi:transposase